MINNNKLCWKEYLLLLLAVVCMFIYSVVGVHIVKVYGTSMAPTIHSGNLVLTTPVHVSADLQRGDIVTFHLAGVNGKSYIKRIIGLPNETIEAQNDMVLIDGKEIGYWFGTGTWGPVVIPADQFFVMGDNRGISNDSRHFGCVTFAQMDLKVVG